MIRRPDPQMIRDMTGRAAGKAQQAFERVRAHTPWAPPEPPSRLKRAAPFVGAGAAGAVLAYIFDRDRGRTRRAKIKDMTAGTIRRGARQTERLGRRISSNAYGMRQRVAHGLKGSDGGIPDDGTLHDKVLSEVFGSREFRGADVLVNVESGVVVLRGQVDRPELIRRLEDEVRHVPGVLDVENLLHTKGTPAPNKAEALFASQDAIRRRPA